MKLLTQQKVSKEIEKLRTLIKHIENVKENMLILAEKAFEQENISLGKQIASRAYKHDNSKFFGVEWDYLCRDSENLECALKQHREINDHHPEYWGGLENMPEICIIEMVCDCKARSEEFGTDFLGWFEQLIKKNGISKTNPVYTTIYYWCEQLLEKPC